MAKKRSKKAQGAPKLAIDSSIPPFTQISQSSPDDPNNRESDQLSAERRADLLKEEGSKFFKAGDFSR